jgi:hypothetical protein
VKRKIALALSGMAVVGAALAVPGVASAQTSPGGGTWAPGGVYPDNFTCLIAGWEGLVYGEWTNYYCVTIDSYGDNLLWVYVPD